MKLPQYQPQFNYQSPSIPGPRLNNPPAVQTNAAMFGGQQGQDLQRLGGQLQQTASRAAYIYDDYNSTKAQEAGNAFQREFLEWQSAANQKKGKDAENIAADYAKWSQERLSTLGRDLNPVQRGRFQEMAAQSGAAQQRWATDYGAEQKRVHQIGELDAGIKIAQDTVVTNIGDPEMTDIALEQIKDQAFSRAKMQGLGEKATMELMHESAKGALVPAISGVIKNSDTGLASALIDRYAPQLGASAKELAASLNQERERLRAKAEMERLRAEAKAEANRNKAMRGVMGHLDDAKYAAQFMNDTSALQGLASQAAALGEPEAAAELTTMADFWKANKAASDFASSSDLSDVMQKMNGIGEALTSTEGMSVDEHQKLSGEFKAMAEVLNVRVAALKDDPALAADRSSRSVLPDDATLQDRTVSRMEYQERNGVLPENRKPLTRDEATRTASRWQNAGPDEKTALLYGKQGIMEEFGRFAPQVMAQIGITPLEQDMAQRVSKKPETVNAANHVFKVLAMDNKDIPDVTVTTDLGDVLSRSTAYQAYMAHARHSDSVESSQAASQMEKTASRMLKLGNSPDDVLKTLDAGIKGISYGNMALTIPDDKSASQVEDRLQRELDKRLPMFLEGLPYADEFVRKENLARLKQDGVWVNAPDGDGYVLLDPVTKNPMTDGQGKYLRVTDAEAFAVDSSGDDQTEKMRWMIGGITGVR